MSSEWLGEDFRCDWCDLHWPHHHEERTAPAGNIVEVVVYHAEDPNAEVRDPDTGEVIFPATKAPFKLLDGEGEGSANASPSAALHGAPPGSEPSGQ